MININAQFILIVLQKLIANKIVFKIASQCYLSEIITLQRSKCNKLLRHFLTL